MNARLRGYNHKCKCLKCYKILWAPGDIEGQVDFSSVDDLCSCLENGADYNILDTEPIEIEPSE